MAEKVMKNENPNSVGTLEHAWVKAVISYPVEIDQYLQAGGFRTFLMFVAGLH